MATQVLPRATLDVMRMLHQHVPLTLLVDLAFPGWAASDADVGACA